MQQVSPEQPGQLTDKAIEDMRLKPGQLAELQAQQAKTQPDQELRSMRRIGEIVEALPPDARGRVITYVANRYSPVN